MEKGESLSGGQGQRISLARAIIKKPDIFILDEATSDLDVLSEREIYRRMLKLAQGKTTVLVTHNIFEAMSVENVIVMSKGRILEQGTLVNSSREARSSTRCSGNTTTRIRSSSRKRRWSLILAM